MKLPLDKDSKIIIITDEYDNPNFHELLKGKEAEFEVRQAPKIDGKLYIDSIEPRNRAERRKLKNKHKHTTIP